MADKPKVAFYWCASCGGCEESVVDLAENVVSVLDAVDIVLWPVAMDFKRSDVEALPDSAIAASFINGAVRSSEQEEMVHLLRRKSQVVIAYGACAQMGGIPGLANQFQREQILKYVYEEAPTVERGSDARPLHRFEEQGRAVTLPVMHQVVRTLGQVVEVDYTLPGCPPTPRLLLEAVQALLSGTLPERGSVLAPDVALCDECPRKESKPSDLAFESFVRPHRVQLDLERCFLAQGVVCMGPATRGGCEGLCVKGNMPCTGCFGPTSRIKDQGAKILSFLCSSLKATDEQAIDRTLDTLPDPVGTFYRYGLPGSLLRRRVTAE